MAKSTSQLRYGQNVTRFYIFGALANFNLWIATLMYYQQQERGLSLATIGLMEALATVASALAEVPTGAFADTFGRRTSLLVGAVSLGLVIALYGVVSWLPLLLALHIIWNLCQSFFSGADQALLYDSLKADGREGTFTLASGRYSAIGSASAAIASLVGTWVAQVSLSLPFVLCGLCVIGAGLWTLNFKEPPRESDARPSVQETWRIMRAATVRSLVEPRLRYPMLFGAAMLVPGFFYAFFFLQPYGMQHHWSIGWVGVLMLAMRGAGMIGAMLSHRLHAWLGEKRPLFAMPFVVAVGLGLFAVSPPLVGIPLAFLLAIYFAACRPMTGAMLNRLFPSEQRATFLSIYMLLYTVFIVPAQLGLTKLADVVGLSAAYLVLAACTLVIGGLLLALGALRTAQSYAAERG